MMTVTFRQDPNAEFEAARRIYIASALVGIAYLGLGLSIALADLKLSHLPLVRFA
jgi:hypothetical protein